MISDNTPENEGKTLDEIKSLIEKLPGYIIIANQADVPVKFKEWREFRKMTLKAVETQSGVSNAYLSQLETGKVSKPSFEVVCKLCSVYNIRLIIH